MREKLRAAAPDLSPPTPKRTATRLLPGGIIATKEQRNAPSRIHREASMHSREQLASAPSFATGLGARPNSRMSVNDFAKPRATTAMPASRSGIFSPPPGTAPSPQLQRSLSVATAPLPSHADLNTAWSDRLLASTDAARDFDLSDASQLRISVLRHPGDPTQDPCRCEVRRRTRWASTDCPRRRLLAVPKPSDSRACLSPSSRYSMADGKGNAARMTAHSPRSTCKLPVIATSGAYC